MAKSLYIKTYGCQMNVYDSARMAEVLAPLGYAVAATAAAADMVILNTCHIREKASEKLFSELGRLREGRGGAAAAPILAVTGCVAQAEGAEILRRAPAVDIVLGPQAYHRLPELVARAERARALKSAGRRAGAGIVMTDFPVESKFDHLPAPATASGLSAFLTIQEGCDRFCTFCVVPYTRGAEFSRPAAAIRAEAERLAALGAREITLLGQNVNAWHGAGAGGGWGFARLLHYLAERVPDVLRWRYTTSHPGDMDEALIAAHGEIPSLMPYLHLPVQSGSDRILAAMNRRHDVALYRDVVARLRARRPDIALSSDFIVGFPGESEADFQATLDLVGEIGFASAFSFKYSPRPGTPAALLEGQVPEPVKAERLARLQSLLNAQLRDFNRATLGRRLPVLLEKPGRRPGQLIGKSPYLQAVHVEAPAALAGRLAEIEIVGLAPFSLQGRLAA